MTLEELIAADFYDSISQQQKGRKKKITETTKVTFFDGMKCWGGCITHKRQPLHKGGLLASQEVENVF
jgi:hypothetical protein